jgi:hypothetical protein
MQNRYIAERLNAIVVRPYLRWPLLVLWPLAQDHMDLATKILEDLHAAPNSITSTFFARPAHDGSDLYHL